MRLYEINAELDRLLSQVDEDTGELLVDEEALEALTLARDEKIEGCALAIKNYDSDIAAIKAEEDALKKRRETLTNQRDWAKKYLDFNLRGEKFESPRCVVSYRKSESVQLDAEAFLKWAKRHKEYLRIRDPEPDKTAIKAALKAGEAIKGAWLETGHSLVVK